MLRLRVKRRCLLVIWEPAFRLITDMHHRLGLATQVRAFPCVGVNGPDRELLDAFPVPKPQSNVKNEG